MIFDLISDAIILIQLEFNIPASYRQTGMFFNLLKLSGHIAQKNKSPGNMTGGFVERREGEKSLFHKNHLSNFGTAI
jgi:hypothetical protein